ncbi:hypothetical protein QBC35DRAFT_494345 [Podospora australis]|uniref:Uncharacterized protein n=1 Tax=Podospora australis TaxID=1536484 RepID=A0AAN6WVH9_9PEZI|nr:hypothetical protein QBC35DRAFT_494345 [Podospora australis]
MYPASFPLRGSRGVDESCPGRASYRPQGVPFDNDDESTVYSDVESYDSDSSSIVIPFRASHRQDKAPRLRLKEDEGSKPVYEAWNIYFFPERQEIVCGKKVLGINIQEYDHFESRVSLMSRPSEQSELALEHLRAVREYQQQNRRGWAGKLLRGDAKTYEEDLNEKCEKLPDHVKQALTSLLLDKGRATSTRFRTRTWTVVSMREQSFFRFTGKDFTEVKNQTPNKSSGTPMVYSVVIQGNETKVSTTADGVATSDAWSNPWANADHKEISNKSRERSRRKADARAKSFEFDSPPSYRSSSPQRDRCSRSRYVSPPSYETSFRRSRARSVSPEPVRIRVQRRNRSQDSISDYRPSPFDRDPYSAPTPPESYTPPPGVTAFGLPPPMPHNAANGSDFGYTMPAAQQSPFVPLFHPPPPLDNSHWPAPTPGNKGFNRANPPRFVEWAPGMMPLFGNPSLRPPHPAPAARHDPAAAAEEGDFVYLPSPKKEPFVMVSRVPDNRASTYTPSKPYDTRTCETFPRPGYRPLNFGMDTIVPAPTGLPRPPRYCRNVRTREREEEEESSSVQARPHDLPELEPRFVRIFNELEVPPPRPPPAATRARTSPPGWRRPTVDDAGNQEDNRCVSDTESETA